MEVSETNSKHFFYFISAVLPASNKTGGEIVLYRHFEERKDYSYQVIELPVHSGRIFKALESSRFRTYIKSLMPFYEWVDISKLQNLPKPLFVFTVAHGRQCYSALKAARYWNVPLITIFHDWYPASSDVHPWFQFFIDREFRNLYQRSSLALCVSKQMKEALGRHSNSIVLPPIPSFNKSGTGSKNRTLTPQLLYAGFCGGAYREMLNRFMAIEDREEVIIKIAGANTEGLNTTYKNVSILGFIPEQDFAAVFNQAHILLVFLNFEKKSKKHFSTHFPSKIVEYCGHGKMIAVWGPSYATAVQWAKETRAAFFYDKNDAEGFSRELLKVFHTSEKKEAYIRQATYIYYTQFASDIVDAQLKNAIHKVIQL